MCVLCCRIYQGCIREGSLIEIQGQNLGWNFSFVLEVMVMKLLQKIYHRMKCGRKIVSS